MPWQSRTGKAIGLLQFLIFNQGVGFSKDKLFEIIYNDDSEIDPSNTFRVTMHRIRRMLVSAGLPELPYITCRNGICSWNADIPCQVDAREFEQYIKKASNDNLSSEEKINAYKNAFELYKGEFLPMASAENWVAVEAVRYKSLYSECIASLTKLLNKIGDYETTHEINSRASSIYPYDEEFHAGKIKSLMDLRRYNDAHMAFENVTQLFFEELGIKPSEKLIALHKEISANIPSVSESLESIKAYLSADESGDGAYYCNFLTFVDSYRFVMRIIERSGQSVYLMLCSLTDVDGNELEGDKLAEASASLHTAIKSSLRRGDLYTRYNPNQFLVLLLGINKENCSIVADRIVRRYKELYTGRGSRLRYKVVSAAEFQSESESLSFKAGTLKW